MRKTDKKIDKEIRAVLKEVCEDALKNVAGFNWLTHYVSYDDFPASLLIVCVFESKESLNRAYEQKADDYLIKNIQNKLLKSAVKIKNSRQQVSFDTESGIQQKQDRTIN